MKKDNRKWENSLPEQKNFPDFWEFEKAKVFIGKILSLYEHNPEGLPEAEWKAFLCEDESGVKFYLPNHKAIQEAFEKHGAEVLYRVEFLKEVKMKGDKTFMRYNIQHSAK